MAAPSEFISYVDNNKTSFIQRLREAVAIPSVSGEAAHRPDVLHMAEWLEAQLKQYGVETKSQSLGSQTLEGKELDLPPAILGRIGFDKAKKTVLIYGHFDVQPAYQTDGWESDPFKLVEKPDGRLVGRGSSDDKGPILGWLNVLEAAHSQKLELPVNLRFVFEGMEESGSEGLDDFINSEASNLTGWFQDVDCVCISDNYWLNDRTPCLTHGLRGITYYHIIVHGPARDLHSGVFGRTVHEPMTDLIYLMSRLVNSDGTILIPGVQDLVSPPTEAEKETYKRLDYSIADVESAAGGKIALSSEKEVVLMGRMREPSLSLHGIEGAFYGPGNKTVIPARVAGKFSIRLVPPQTPENVNPLIEKYIKEEFDKLNSKNTLTVSYQHGGKPWVADDNHWSYEAAKRATRTVYGKEPDLTREGGSIPVTLTFADALGVNVLLLPMGRGDDGAHSTNEKLDESNFINGTKLLGSYLWEIAAGTSGKA